MKTFLRPISSGISIAFAFAFCFAVLASPASAATRTWTGTTNGNWTVSTNWSGSVAPVAGDDLVFPAAAATFLTTNDFAAFTSFHSITIQNFGYSLAGNAISINGSITHTDTNLLSSSTIQTPLKLTAPVTISSAGALFVYAIDLNGQTLTFSGSGDVYNADVISNTGAVVKSGNGDLRVNAANTYDGATTVNAGRIVLNAANGLGTLTSGTVVNAGAAISFAGGITVAEPLTLNGLGPSGNGALQIPSNLTLSGVVTLNGLVRIYMAGSTTSLSSAIAGTGSLQLAGAGQLALNASGNSLTGVSFDPGFSSQLAVQADEALPSSLIINVPTNAKLQIFANQTLRGLTGTGQIELNVGLTVATLTNDLFVFSGTLVNSGSMSLVGLGTQEFAGPSTNYTGTATMSSGGLFFIGGTVRDIVVSSGYLGLSSAVTARNVSLTGGTYAPGAGGYGDVNMQALNIAAPATFVEGINTTDSGFYGRTAVTGTVTLTNPTLNLSSPSIFGAPLAIIDNQGALAVSGTFSGIPEGGLIVNGPRVFHLSYIGGDGNDVTLTQVPRAATRTPI